MNSGVDDGSSSDQAAKDASFVRSEFKRRAALHEAAIRQDENLIAAHDRVDAVRDHQHATLPGAKLPLDRVVQRVLNERVRLPAWHTVRSGAECNTKSDFDTW